jgi:dihydrofolate reductase
MSRVIAEISMSLDGYVTARGAGQEHGLGIGGEAIQAWVLGEPRSPVDQAVLTHSFEETGAVVMGRRLYDIVDGPDGWNDDLGGANVIDQSLAARLVDELRIHLSPLVLSEGTRLFDLVGPTRLVQREVVTSPRATHLTYEVVRN